MSGCRCYIAGRHKLRASSLSKLAYDLGPLCERHGALPVQRLTKAHVDALIIDLLAGGTKTAKGRTRGKWSAVAVNKMVATISQVFADAQRQVWSAATWLPSSTAFRSRTSN